MKKLMFLLLVLSIDSFIFGQENSIDIAKEDEEANEIEESGDSELDKRSDKATANIGYLFRGYSIIEGNPLDPKKFDPGFKTEIFEATYNKDRTTADGRYKIPDGVEITSETSCSLSFSSETVMTISDYKNALKAKTSPSGSGSYGLFKGSFSASAEYNRMSSTLKSNDKSVISSEATCTVYAARLHLGTPPKFTENFLASLRLAAKTKDYGRLLDSHGTHFIETVDMGARFTKLQEISKASQDKMQQEGIDVKLSASVSAAGIGSVSTDNEVSTDRTDKETFEKAVKRTELVTIGSKPPADGKKATWLASAMGDPLPVYYGIKSILEIFTPSFFEDTDMDYESIRGELEDHLKGYCNRLKTSRFPNVECEGPPKGCAGGSQCSANAICNDIENAAAVDDDTPKYTCSCKKGFEGNGKICTRNSAWQMGKEIYHEDTRGAWGTWGGPEYCVNGEFARGFIFRAQKWKRNQDDTGGNAVCLKCGDQDVCSKKAVWGTWSEPQLCPEGSYLSGWRQNVEPLQGRFIDDTMLDNVEYRCRDAQKWEKVKDMKVEANEWGTWSRWKECPRGEYICGIETKVENPAWDNTALNDIKHTCCKPIQKKKKKAKATNRKIARKYGVKNLRN